MSYRVRLEPAVERQLRRLDRPVLAEVVQRIDSLAQDPRPPGCRRLTGVEPGWALRVGKHRILYLIEDNRREVSIYEVGRRDKVYKKR